MVKFQMYFAWFSLKNNHFLSKMLLQLTIKRTEKPRIWCAGLQYVSNNL